MWSALLQNHKRPSTRSISLYCLSFWRTEKWPVKYSSLWILSLKALSHNQWKQTQSVCNPVPIWASLRLPSFAFVLWLSEGQAPHAADKLKAFIKYAPSSCHEKSSEPDNLITDWGASTYVNLHLFSFKERDSPGLSRTQPYGCALTHTLIPLGPCQSRIAPFPTCTRLPLRISKHILYSHLAWWLDNCSFCHCYVFFVVESDKTGPEK